MIHMKTEFNVGDMVRVKSKKELIDIFGVTQDGYITGNKGGWVKEMYDVCEKEGFVIIVNQKYGVEVQFNNGDSWNFSPSALEKIGITVRQKDDYAHITFNGDTDYNIGYKALDDGNVDFRFRTAAFYKDKNSGEVKQKDDYVRITFNGDTTTATDGKRTVSVKRYHDDEYDKNVAIAEVTKKLFHHFPEEGDVYYSVSVCPKGARVDECIYHGYSIDKDLKKSGNFYKNRATAEKVAASINKTFEGAKDYE